MQLISGQCQCFKELWMCKWKLLRVLAIILINADFPVKKNTALKAGVDVLLECRAHVTRQR